MASKLDEACPIWGEIATVTSSTFNGWTVSGNRTHGAYRIASSVLNQVGCLPLNEKAKLTTWIVDQHRAGTMEPMIISETLQKIGSQRQLTYNERMNRYFLMLRAHDAVLDSNVRIFGHQDSITDKWKGYASAWMEVAQSDDLTHLINALKDGNFLRNDAGDSLVLTAKGLDRIDSLALVGAESDQAFVALWFSTKLDEAWTSGFELGIAESGYRALRIDKKEHANKIDDEIIAEIRRSRFLVADFTCELIKQKKDIVPAPRGGVYYEAGFAQGLGIPVIWTVREDCIDYVHFDTRQYAHIVWSNPEDLRVKLRNRIGAVIGDRGAT